MISIYKLISKHFIKVFSSIANVTLMENTLIFMIARCLMIDGSSYFVFQKDNFSKWALLIVYALLGVVLM